MKFFSIICLVLFFTEVSGQHEPRTFNLKEIKGQFKHFNLKTFDIDSLSEPEITIDEIDRYYSKQENKRGLNEFSIYYWEEGEILSGFQITYLIFDSKGTFISSFEVASSKFEFGQEKYGWFSKSKGKFANDSTYELLSEHGWIGETMTETTYSKIITKIKNSGKIEQQTTVIKTEKTPTH